MNLGEIILANTGPRDDPIDTPSHCSYNTLSNEKAVFVHESRSNFFIVLFEIGLYQFIIVNPV